MSERIPLLILHGAIGAASQFEPLLPLLEERFEPRVLDFLGHGAGASAEEPFSIELFAGQLAGEIERSGNRPADIFGYSMGGYVALHLARTRPELVGRVFTLSTKFRWDEETSAREVKMLDPRKIEEKVPRFAEELRRRHAAHGWERVLTGTAEMMLSLGRRPVLTAEDAAGIAQRVRVAVGDRDQMVTLEETSEVYRRLPAGELAVLPGTQHPIEKVPSRRLAAELVDFFCC